MNNQKKNSHIVWLLLLLWLFFGMQCGLDPFDDQNGDNDTPAKFLKLRWEYNSHGFTDMDMPLGLIDNSTIVLGEFDQLTSLSILNGNVNWSSPFSSALTSDYFLIGGRNVLGRNYNRLQVWEKATGAQQWEFTLPDSIRGYPYSGDALSEKTVYLALADYIL